MSKGQKWLTRYSLIIRQKIKSGERFTVNQLCEEIPMSVSTIKKYIVKEAKDMGLKMGNVHNPGGDSKIYIKAGSSEALSYVQHESKSKNNGGLIKYKCRCMTEIGAIWLNTISETKEQAIETILKETPGIKEVLNVYTMEEYYAVSGKKDSDYSGKGSKIAGNPIGFHVGRAK